MPDLETRLYALAADATWPPTPDLQAAVLAHRPPAPRPHRTRRILAAALAALVLIPAAGAVAFPGARDDVLEWLGLRHVTVRRVPAPPPGARPELEDDLGAVMPLAAAERQAGFKALVPRALGPPDRVRTVAQRISLVYAPRPGLPKLKGVGAGLILTQTRGGIQTEFLQKLVIGDTQVRRVRVNGRPAAFISGGAHTYLYVAPGGDVLQDHPLLAGPTLIWERAGHVLRLESRGKLKKLLQIAGSVAP
jgi:hypothetical protein